MNALKSQWIIRWGVLPGTPEGSKTITYTSEEYDNDNLDNWTAGELSTYEMKVAEVNFLMLSLQNPRTYNWVTLEWLWL